MSGSDEARWLVMIHHIPPKPNYLRVKIGRRLQGLGAVAIKSSVYVLPRSEPALEDFQWLRREILAGGGDATLCEARFVEGHTDADVEALFQSARERDYKALATEARRMERRLARPKRRKSGRGPSASAVLQRLQRRLAEIAAIDFFGAAGREQVGGLLAGIEARLRPPADAEPSGPGKPTAHVRGRTWVTRRGVAVDRIASAWLIRRFIDPEARFAFAPGHDYEPNRGELRFDMFEAEFTHEGDRCTFEVLCERFGLTEPALVRLGEVVHDIDLKDGKYGRPEAPGVEHLLAGIALRNRDDTARLTEGAAVLEALYASFSSGSD